MKVIATKPQEALQIGPQIVVRVLKVAGGRVTLGVDAPGWEVHPRRGETRNNAAEKKADGCGDGPLA